MRVTCPKCGHTNTRPSARKRLLDPLLKLVFMVPYRCRTCLKRFYVFTPLSQRTPPTEHNH
jgi:hypothetical protein